MIFWPDTCIIRLGHRLAGLWDGREVLDVTAFAHMPYTQIDKSNHRQRQHGHGKQHARHLVRRVGFNFGEVQKTNVMNVTPGR